MNHQIRNFAYVASTIVAHQIKAPLTESNHNKHVQTPETPGLAKGRFGQKEKGGGEDVEVGLRVSDFSSVVGLLESLEASVDQRKNIQFRDRKSVV